MKKVKLVGLIAVAVLALTAAFGSASASAATTLCKVNTEPCAEANRYPTATVIESEAINPVIPGYACTKSTMTAETSEQVGTPLHAKITSLSFSGCGGGCKSIKASGTFSSSTEATSEGNGSFSTPLQLSFSECTGGSTCKFGSEKMSGTFHGGATPYIEFAKSEMKFEGGNEAFCGKTITVTSKYNIKSPQPIYVRTNKVPSALCSKNTAPCAAGNTYAAGTTITGVLDGITTPSSSFVTEGKMLARCTSSSLGGKTTTQSGLAVPVEITSLTFSACDSVCPTVEAQHLPYSAEAERTTGGNGTVTVKSGGSGKPQLKFNCSWGSCVFGANELAFTFEGGNPAKLVAAKPKTTREEGSEFFCGNTATLRGTWNVTSPTPLYLTEKE